MFPSDIVLRATGMPPQGKPWPVDSVCSCCGKPIRAGDIGLKTPFKGSFTDDVSLAARTGVICGACAVVVSGIYLTKLQKVVITPDAVYSISTDNHRAWFLLTPPEPPFVAVSSPGMTPSHMIWRTPVTRSRDLMFVRVGNDLHRIRRPVLLDAIEWCREAGAAFITHHEAVAAAKEQERASSPGPRRKKAARLPVPPPHPFLALSRNGLSASVGAFRPDIAAMEEARPWLEKLACLTPGELWGLATLVKRKPAIPEAPANIAEEFKA